MSEMAIEAKDLNQQGWILLKTGSLEDAKEKFEKAIECDPMLMDSYKNYANYFMKIKDYENAKNYYKKAIMIAKEGALYFGYGNACLMSGELEECIENYNTAINLGFDGAQMLYFTSKVYEKMGNKDMALRYMQRACMKDPARERYAVEKARMLFNMDLYDEAEKEVDEILIKFPEIFYGYHMKTIILLARKNNKGALEFAKKAFDRFPEDFDLLLDCVKAAIINGEYGMAKELINTAKTFSYYEKVKSALLIYQAKIALGENNYVDAIGYFKECAENVEEQRVVDEARFNLISIFMLNKEYEQALEQAEILLKSESKNVYYYSALYYKPFCYKQLGKNEEAEELFKEASLLYRIATFGKAQAVDLYIYRIMCLKEIGDYDKALDLLRFVENVNPRLYHVYTLRADIYRETGKEIQAKEELEKAYEIRPELRAVYENGGN